MFATSPVPLPKHCVFCSLSSFLLFLLFRSFVPNFQASAPAGNIAARAFVPHSLPSSLPLVVSTPYLTLHPQLFHMDLPLLDALPTSPFLVGASDPFVNASCSDFLLDPFFVDDIPLCTKSAPDSTALLLDPFDAAVFVLPPTPNSPLLQENLHSNTLPLPIHLSACVSGGSTTSLGGFNIATTQHTFSLSSQTNTQAAFCNALQTRVDCNVTDDSIPNTYTRVTRVVQVSPEVRNKHKLAQRKLRNKESARRYREKQVARRRQLENYTRTLTQQNRELELLHQKLLSLACERPRCDGGAVM